MGVANAQQHGLDALLLDRLAVLDRHAELVGVERDGCLEVVDGHADMVDRVEHRAAV